MVNEFEIKKQLCDIGKRIYNRNMVAANDGNFSVKVAENEYLCTPTGVSKGFMTPEFICKVDGKGNVIQANPGFKPSSEIKMHMRVYEKRPDVGSVVHAHPIYATSFAIAGIPLTQPIMPEAVIGIEDIGGTLRLGAYPCVLDKTSKAYEMYGTEQISERHRHRYEVNNDYRDALTSHGMKLSGLSPDGRIVEMIEIPEHPWFVATQAHPELKSRPNRPHPLFRGFIEAALKYQNDHK